MLTGDETEMLSDDNENCQPESEPVLSAGVTLNVERAGKTHAKCVVCIAKVVNGSTKVIQ